MNKKKNEDMEIIVFQKFDSYKKDSIKYLVYRILNKPFLIFISLYICIVLINFLNRYDYIKLYPKVLDLLVYSFGVGILAMLLYSLFHLLKTVLELNSKNINKIHKGKLHIKFTKNSISIRKENDSFVYTKDWKYFKELTVLNKTIFFIPVSKNDSLIRINQNEIIEGEFDKIINHIKYLWEAR